ncbi:DUF1127 domain-containing protein [Ruegeria sp. HKCCD6228]|jgi:uncharacterized protein YjiS (DUF1127 family)|uniref:DUF1127 domain-containing protein n=1 Tax=Ruegeria atlantica TaxID=81569 RepID=A0ABX1WDY4_9RHOB|nr:MULTISPECIES: DUF1127 domain-containing protein [Ruegeria]NOC83582.1 DUF1127 domain-containing protein [Ruegeria sp. HKCCD6428]NOD31537.1 DUF1127 domain-containing protein [Ruegeria atlantica]NOD97214.1 DUF1127 domain-containing protein [Ruegeria sp. HKCCD6228]
MAHSATQSHAGFSLPGLIASIGSSIYGALISVAEAQSRVRQVEFLQSLSDEELKKRGLSRERIVHRVFSDSIWL